MRKRGGCRHGESRPSDAERRVVRCSMLASANAKGEGSKHASGPGPRRARLCPCVLRVK